MKFTHTEYSDYNDGIEDVEILAKVTYYPVGNAVAVPTSRIREWVEEGVEFLRENPEDGHIYFESGDTLVNVYCEDEGDMKHFSFTVAKRFQTGHVTVQE